MKQARCKNQIARDFKVSEGLTMKEVSQVKQVSEHTEVGISAFQRLKTLLSRKLTVTMSKIGQSSISTSVFPKWGDKSGCSSNPL